VCLNLIMCEQYQANGESQCESTILAGGVSRIITARPGPLLEVSQAETLLTGQPLHETIFRCPQGAVYHVLFDNFTLLYHLRGNLRRISSLRKH
jgi:hypothetical protein